MLVDSLKKAWPIVMILTVLLIASQRITKLYDTAQLPVGSVTFEESRR